MAPATPSHDPALSHAAAQGSQSTQIPSVFPNLSGAEMPNLSLAGLEQSQILTLLRNIPASVLNKVRLVLSSRSVSCRHSSQESIIRRCLWMHVGDMIALLIDLHVTCATPSTRTWRARARRPSVTGEKFTCVLPSGAMLINFFLLADGRQPQGRCCPNPLQSLSDISTAFSALHARWHAWYE